MTQRPAPLAAAMNARRKELGLRWKDVADQAGLSEETVRVVRNDMREVRQRTTKTEAKIEQALCWQRGSIQTIRDGGRPTPLPGTPGAMYGKGTPLDLLHAPPVRRPGGYPAFVKNDLGYQALWDIPEHLLTAEERKYCILQIELWRWTHTTDPLAGTLA